jgi:hypothetical protein
MSSYSDLTSFAAIYENCVGFNVNDFLTKLFAIIDVWPVFLGFFFIGLTFIHKEAFFFLLTAALLADWGINSGLQILVGASNNVQPASCPISDMQMPAMSSEMMVMLWTFGFGMVILVYPRAVSGMNIVFIVAASQIAIYSRIYLIFSTPSQLLAGAAIGFLEGMVYLSLVSLMRYYGLDRAMIAAPNLFYILPPMSDTIMFPTEPTYVVTSKPTRAQFKVYQERTMAEDADSDLDHDPDSVTDPEPDPEMVYFEQSPEDEVIFQFATRQYKNSK